MQNSGAPETNTSSRLKNYKQTFQSLMQQQHEHAQALAMIQDPNVMSKKRSVAGRATSSVNRKPKKVVNPRGSAQSRDQN